MKSIIKHLIIISIFCLPPLSVKAQRAEIDSINRVLSTVEADTIKAKLYTRLSSLYWYISLDTASNYANIAYDLVKDGQDDNYLIQQADALNNMGVIHQFGANTVEALKNFYTCLEIYKKLNRPVSMARAIGNIAIIYEDKKEYRKAIEQHEAALQIFEKNNRKRNMAIAYANLSMLDVIVGDYSKALHRAKLGIAVATEVNNAELLSIHKTQAGSALTAMTQYDSAKIYLSEALALTLEGGNNYHIARCYEELSILSDSLNDNESLIAYGEKGFEYGKKAGSIERLANLAELLTKGYHAQKQFEQAFEFQEKMFAYQDSLSNEDKNKEIHRLELQKKDTELILERQQRELVKANSDRKTFVIIATVGALISAVILAVLFFRGRQKEKRTSSLLETQKQEIILQNEELQQQSEEIASQRDFIEANNKTLSERNTQITQSINAAKIIQQAMIPFHSRVKELVDEYFVVYEPKDIVSGDFYWINKVEDTVIIAVVDCTGHGVPGAFMSMIGNTLLDEIVMLFKNTNPATILKQLNESILYTLQQEDSHNMNGMDVSLVAIRDLANGSKEVTFSGAKRPLYYYAAGTAEFKIIKGTNKAIGGRQNENKVFENQTLILSTGSMLYLTSDGFEDQHNIHNKKIGRTQLTKFLAQEAQLDVNTQKNHLEQFLKTYKAGVHQRDDILLVGVRI